MLTPVPKKRLARQHANLTYDPSNFTKFFKRFQGCTPKQYRQQVWAAQRAAPGVANAEVPTI